VHELPVVTDALEIAKAEAEKRGFKKVTRITLVLGELSSVMDECVQMYFELLAENTVCEGAELRFEHVPATLRCTACGREFPHEKSFDCPGCGGESVLVKGTGREMYVKSIDGR
jgi:hydrogenase nickel incorporation protein HypA/HybF